MEFWGGMLGGVSRLRRLVLSDRFFFITCRVHPSRRALSGAEMTVLAEAIEGRRRALQFLLTAWAFLPDHWHAIIFPRSPLTVSQAMAAVKVSSAHRISGRHGERGLVWQGRFFDRALRTVKEYHEAVEYIHANPVKAGLATRAKDWPWSSVREYSGTLREKSTRHPVLPIDRVLLPSDERARI